MVYATETEFVTTSMLSRIVTNCSFPFLVAISHTLRPRKPDFRSTPKVLSHYASLVTLPTHTLMHVDVHHRVHLQDRVSGEQRHRLRVRSHVEQPRDLRSSHGTDTHLIHEARHDLADVGNHLVHRVRHYLSPTHCGHTLCQIRHSLHHTLFVTPTTHTHRQHLLHVTQHRVVARRQLLAIVQQQRAHQLRSYRNTIPSLPYCLRW